MLIFTYFMLKINSGSVTRAISRPGTSGDSVDFDPTRGNGTTLQSRPVSPVGSPASDHLHHTNSSIASQSGPLRPDNNHEARDAAALSGHGVPGTRTNSICNVEPKDGECRLHGKHQGKQQ